MRLYQVMLVGAVLCTAVSPVLAGGDSPWTLRFHGALVDSSVSGSSSVTDGVITDVDVGGGFGIGAEYRFSNRLGFQMSALFAGLDIGSRTGPAGVETFEMGMAPFTFGLPIHLTPGSRADLFIEPTISIVSYFDVETTVGGGSVGTNVDVSSDTAPGAALCLDLPLGEGRWALSTGVRYMKTEAENADIDPIIVTIGAAFRI